MWTSKLTDVLGALDYVRVSDNCYNMWTSKLIDVLGALDYVRVSDNTL